MGTVAARTISQHKLNETVIVGKDVLELLSSAMYVDPLCIYREYIQNAADAIDEAVREGLYSRGQAPRIDVSINVAERSIKVRDNGIGIPPNVFSRRLTALGASKKRGSNARGFRGVGRLSGLAYCQQLIFRSKSVNATRAWEIRWDCRRLKELLREPAYRGDVNDAMHEVISFDTFEPEDGVSHYFEVELHNVTRTKNDILLNQVAVPEYLSEIGPVPFSARFSYGRRISAFLAKHGTGTAYAIHVNGGEALVRPFRNTFLAKRTLVDKFTRVEFLEIPGLTEGLDAVGWLLHHGYHGALPSRSGIAGLRLRAGNIQLGDTSLLQTVFPEPRFNYWSVGEIHLLSPRLVPNGRRDELESSIQQQNLLNHASLHAKRLARLCRSCSAERNSGIPVAKTGVSAARKVGDDAAESWLLQNKCDYHLSYLNIHQRQIYRAVLTSLLRASQNAATVQQVIADALPKFREVESQPVSRKCSER